METNSQGEYKEIALLSDTVENDNGYSAVLMDGQYFIQSNAERILIPEIKTEYCFQNTGHELIDTPSEVFHLMKGTENENEVNENQIVYYANDIDIFPKRELNFMDVMELEKNTETEYLDLESLLDIKTENGWTQTNDMNGLQYIVQLQNLGSLETIPEATLDSILDHSYNLRESTVEPPKSIDISKITGKNLLTGQKVTLESYLEKIKNSNNEYSSKPTENISQDSLRKNEHAALSNLLNKKLTIGKTLNGQQLIGKVIHVGKKNVNNELIVEDQLENFENEINILDAGYVDLASTYYDSVESHVPNSVIIEDNQINENIDISEMLVLDDASETVEISNYAIEPDGADENANEMMEYVSKTMVNLTKMESVLKKLKRKNLVIKVVEKVVNGDEVNIKTCHIGGHLEMLGGWQKREYEEKWVFKMDFKKESTENEKLVELWPKKFPETIKITVSILKQDGLIQSTKVNLNYSLEKCSMCSKSFKSIYKLKTHMKVTHNADYQYKCNICEQSFNKKDINNHHRTCHMDYNEHDQSEDKPEGLNLNCTICGDTFDQLTNWKEHMFLHERNHKSNKTSAGKSRLNDMDSYSQSRDIKNCYVCKVCSRTFSRYSNLQRHSEIHGTKNSLALYSCSMCGCTYNYISSLTRHIVQNHMSAT